MYILRPSALGATVGERLQKLGAKYQVARNFALPGVTKSERAEQAPIFWTKVAACVEKAAAEEESKAVETVANLASDLGKVFPGKKRGGDPTLLSAATKFLWFSGRHDIRIYDRRAIAALNSWCKDRRSDERRGWRVDGSYAVFAQEWDRMYQAHGIAIRDAVGSLNQAFRWSLIPEKDVQVAVQTVMRQQWFVERVFDKHLWTIGADDETRVGGFV
ncbi:MULTISPECIES: hypothetical protein [unclassified Caballeronia]|uniref:hypothetical protein n=1 Tax=unclassified Caballeronia TaxID=2646786 RepID=UPI0020294F3A|nr:MULTISPECIES: hypothetical protein [unclassified Caballeronia]MDR5770150.1 hypothetical protein [Caballeronia sp. LZ028]